MNRRKEQKELNERYKKRILGGESLLDELKHQKRSSNTLADDIREWQKSSDTLANDLNNRNQ